MTSSEQQIHYLRNELQITKSLLRVCEKYLWALERKYVIAYEHEKEYEAEHNINYDQLRAILDCIYEAMRRE